MKKVSSIILCTLFLLSFGGCAKSNEVNARATEWGYFYFPKTDWGMTEDELLSALEREKSDFTIGELPNKQLYYKTEYTVFGDKVETGFTFMKSLTSDTPRLSSVQWDYETGFTKEKCEEVMKELSQLFKAQGIAVSEDWDITQTDPSDLSEDEKAAVFYRLKSKAQMMDLPQDVRNKYNKKVRDLYKSGKYDFPAIGDIDIDNHDFVQAQNTNMCAANIAENEDGSGHVWLSGNTVVQIAEYN